MTSKAALPMLDQITFHATNNYEDDIIVNSAPPGSPAGVFASKVSVSVSVPIAGDYIVTAILNVSGAHITKAGETASFTRADGRQFTINSSISGVVSRIGMDGVGDITVTDGQNDTAVQGGTSVPLANQKVFTNVQPGIHVFSLYVNSGWVGGTNQCTARAASIKVTRIN